MFKFRWYPVAPSVVLLLDSVGLDFDGRSIALDASLWETPGAFATTFSINVGQSPLSARFAA